VGDHIFGFPKSTLELPFSVSVVRVFGTKSGVI